MNWCYARDGIPFIVVILNCEVEVAFPRFAPELTELLSADYLLCSALIIVGAVLGFIGSLFSTRKFVGEPSQRMAG